MPKAIKLDPNDVAIALLKCHGCRTAAAQMLDVSAATLRRTISRHPEILARVALGTTPNCPPLPDTEEFDAWELRNDPAIYTHFRFYNLPEQRRLTDEEIAQYKAKRPKRFYPVAIPKEWSDRS